MDALWRALRGPTEACLRWLRLAADSGGVFEEVGVVVKQWSKSGRIVVK